MHHSVDSAEIATRSGLRDWILRIRPGHAGLRGRSMSLLDLEIR